MYCEFCKEEKLATLKGERNRIISQIKQEAREELVEQITNLPFASHAVEGNRLAKFVRLEDIVALII